MDEEACGIWIPSITRGVGTKEYPSNPISHIYGIFGYYLLLKTENWKYCSKIIFKYVNGTVGPSLIFFLLNKVFTDPMNSAQDPLKK